MPHKAFLSSTFKDLAKHREYAIDQLRKAGFDVVTMEDWTAASDAPRVFAPERVSDCDLMVLLVAQRRGHIPEGSDKSITELEYQAALDAEIDVLPFFLDDDAPWFARWDERKEDPRLELWREEISQKHGVGIFALEAHSLPLGPALTRWLDGRKPVSPEATSAPMPPARGPTKVLILGREEEGSLAAQFLGSLSRIRSLECSIVSKDSPDLTSRAGAAHVIIVSFHSEPVDARERDARLMKDLRPWKDNLLLIAKNREDLMEVLDDIMLTPDSVYKITSPEDLERRLLARLFDWNFTHTAMVSTRERDAAPARRPAHGTETGSGALGLDDAMASGSGSAWPGSPAKLLLGVALAAVAVTIFQFIVNYRA